MTRQNVTDGVREILTHRCPLCDGEGVIESAETMAIRIVRKLRDVIAEQAGAGAYLVRVNPRVAAELIDPRTGSARSRRRRRSSSTSKADRRCR